MKAQMIEKNGFPKPIGFMLIFLMISMVCFAQCLFSQTDNANTTGERINFTIVEAQTEKHVDALLVNESYLNTEKEVKIDEWMYNEYYLGNEY